MFVVSSYKKTILIGGLVVAMIILVYQLTNGWLIDPRIIISAKDKCLKDSQYVEISLEDNQRRSESYISIVVKNKDDGTLTNEIRQSIISASHYHPYEQEMCAVYFLRSFNYNYESSEPLPGYQASIWKYRYDGTGEELIRIGEAISGNRNDYVAHYQSDFRISPDERYINLITSYLSEPDYALIIKDLNTKANVFQLQLAELLEKDEQFAGSFGFLEWTDDGRYFWTSLYEGAYVKGWVRIDTADWSYEAFLAPPDRTLNGYPLNTETGWVPFMPGGVWTGMDIVEEQVSQDRAARGGTLDLYLYNIYTEEEILVADTDATSWVDVGTVWINNQTLEYKLPNGEKTTFSLSN